jgi:Calx-beta domain
MGMRRVYIAGAAATVADGDYIALATTTLMFAPGETTKNVTVDVNGDTTNEADEAFHVDLSNATNATIGDALGVGTIANDDPVPDVTLDVIGSLSEGSGSAMVRATLSAVSGHHHPRQHHHQSRPHHRPSQRPRRSPHSDRFARPRVCRVDSH